MAEESKEIEPQGCFLELFKQDKYRQQFAQLSMSGKTSVTVKFSDIVNHEHSLGEHLIDDPVEFLKHARNAAMEQLQIEDDEYHGKIKGVDVRIIDLYSTTPLREISAATIGKLIQIRGIVVKQTVGKPKAINAAFECRRCGTITHISQTRQTVTLLKSPLECEGCQKKGPFEFVEEESEFINEQEIWVQESSDELPPGQLPRSLHIKLLGELVDTARPGDDVTIIGIVRSLPRRLSRGAVLSTFDVYIDVNNVHVLGKEPEAIADPADASQILELGKDPFVHKKIIASIAPSIFGYDTIKESVMYLLFGGVPKEREDIKIRGEMNILLIGDPGTAKSQLLRYVAQLAPRGLFTSGKGTTGVGLTAAVIKDQTSGEYSLEAGALVLADKGTCCIDEFDKMHEGDRETIHETLEQHTVSIAKAGIVATLNARCSVLAAANPVLGRYNAFTTVVENINLPVTLLSRFDLIFLMRDVPNVEKDTELSTHILGLHSGSEHEPVISSRLLRKYVAYAKQINPVLTKEATECIQAFYLRERKASEKEGSPLAIGPRQLEALTRLSEARARAALRAEVTVEDTEAAIRITTQSMVEVGIDLGTGKPDIDILMTGKPKGARDKMQQIIKAIIELSKDTGMVERDYLIKQLGETYSISDSDAQKYLQQLLRDGTLFAPRDGYLKKA